MAVSIGSGGAPGGLRLKFADMFAAPTRVQEIAASLGSGLQTSDWSQEILAEEKRCYAATDAIAALVSWRELDGMLQGKAEPPAGVPAGLPFAIHHHNLTQSGIHNIQNANLGAMAKDKVWLSCTIILPLRTQGASGSPVRPVAIGAPAP